MTQTLLIIDDDVKLIDLLSEYFRENGFDVLSILEGTHAEKTIREKAPDLIILDIMLPGKDGLDVLKDIRSTFSTPVIMLTARGDDTDRIVGLELGADDYLPKPFNPRELLARIRAILRRQGGAASPREDTHIRSGDMVLNRAARELKIGERPVELSTTEFNILEVMMKSPNTVLSRDQIMNLAQGKDFMAFDRSVDIHISKLRAKIEKDPSSPTRIKTVWGTGYMFVDQE
ncbi:MAG TPA: two-component system response regulator OmpR [Desulfobacteraceae bacterium]|nr:two-component system response regulator OmpR [Desulfobacteraceae bacterium]|tara:strand:+ start:1105 stop:1797 length:693 start_codon:yes stop_codon:yes gene_type:complete